MASSNGKGKGKGKGASIVEQRPKKRAKRSKQDDDDDSHLEDISKGEFVGRGWVSRGWSFLLLGSCECFNGDVNIICASRQG